MKKILAIDLGGTNIRTGIVYREKLMSVKSVNIDSSYSFRQVMDILFDLIDQYIKEDLTGIGIGVPSVVDTEKGIVYNVQNIPSWQEVHLKSIIETKYDLPAFINNDANCFALAEKYFGKGKNVKSFIGLTIGTGLGAGIIINDRLYEGKNCGAGEIGMINYKDSIFENYCSGQFFSRLYNLSGEEVFHRAEENDALAKKILFEFGMHLGNAVKALLYAYDPEMIILGGSVSKSFSYFEKSIQESLNDFAYPNTIKNLKMEVSDIEFPGVLGAAALVLKQFDFQSTSDEQFY